MGDINQLAYLEHWVPKVDGPVLEVGSKDYGSTASFRMVNMLGRRRGAAA